MFQPTGGESWFDLLKRAKVVLDFLIVKYVKKDFQQDQINDFNEIIEKYH